MHEVEDQDMWLVQHTIYRNISFGRVFVLYMGLKYCFGTSLSNLKSTADTFPMRETLHLFLYN